jgi:hypothetical protein
MALVEDSGIGSRAHRLGKAENLKKRISAYMRYGHGREAPHDGGKYVWQIENKNDLRICWRAQSRDVDHEAVEKALISDFVRQYGAFPFANRRL